MQFVEMEVFNFFFGIFIFEIHICKNGLTIIVFELLLLDDTVSTLYRRLLQKWIRCHSAKSCNDQTANVWEKNESKKIRIANNQKWNVVKQRKSKTYFGCDEFYDRHVVCQFIIHVACLRRPMVVAKTLSVKSVVSKETLT